MNALKAHLDRSGLTSKELAGELGIHPSQVTRWIKWGMPVPERHVEAVAKLLSIHPATLRAPRKTEAA